MVWVSHIRKRWAVVTGLLRPWEVAESCPKRSMISDIFEVASLIACECGKRVSVSRTDPARSHSAYSLNTHKHWRLSPRKVCGRRFEVTLMIGWGNRGLMSKRKSTIMLLVCSAILFKFNCVCQLLPLQFGIEKCEFNGALRNRCANNLII